MECEDVRVYFSGIETSEPGQKTGPYIRPHFNLYIVIKGRGILQKGADIFHVEEGDIFLTRPDEIIYLEADLYEPWTVVFTAFSGPGTRKLIDKTWLPENPVYTMKKNWKAYAKRAKELPETFRTDTPSEITLLGELLTLLGPVIKEKRVPDEGETTKEYYMGLAKEYMRNNYSYDVRIHEVADYIGIDRSYLYRLFKENEGVAPREYLIQYRLEIARGMLESGMYRPKEITLSCGFPNEESFRTCFFVHCGMTPEEYMWKKI